MTMQAFGALLAGYALRPHQALAATMLYLACGAAGLPVFAPGSSGLAGLTGGYIIGFVAAAWLVSLLKGPPGAGYGRLLTAGAVGTIAILVVGVIWRVPALGGDLPLAIRTGLVPFLGKSLVELFLAAGLVRSVRGLRGYPSG